MTQSSPEKLDSRRLDDERRRFRTDDFNKLCMKEHLCKRPKVTLRAFRVHLYSNFHAHQLNFNFFYLVNFFR